MPYEVKSQAPLLALVLAGGEGRRFGSDKRFARTAGGTSLLQATLNVLGHHVPELFVAVRPEDLIDATWPSQASGAEVHYLKAPHASQGMGCTLSDAVRQLPPDRDVLVALADMPFLNSDTVANLLQRFRDSAKEAPIAFPVYVPLAKPGEPSPEEAGRRGHPVIFHRSYRSRLEQLDGDTGANPVIAAHPGAHEVLKVQDPGVLRDVDQPQDIMET